MLADAMRRANAHGLRAYDAVQLSVAIDVNRFRGGGVTLVSADRDLNAAAIAEGLTVDDPNSHP
jgi:predicted nucleic acid-binding protein